jgi:hypothetical protein
VRTLGDNDETFPVEEVTPYRMQLVDQLLLEDLERGLIRDNRHEIHRFRCIACGRYAVAMDLHLGETQAIVPCPFESCVGAPTATTEHKRIRVSPETHRDLEFYRPFTQEEIDIWIEAMKLSAKVATSALGIDPRIIEGEAPTQEILDTAATRLINGLLLPRPAEQHVRR